MMKPKMIPPMTLLESLQLRTGTTATGWTNWTTNLENKSLGVFKLYESNPFFVDLELDHLNLMLYDLHGGKYLNNRAASHILSANTTIPPKEAAPVSILEIVNGQVVREEDSTTLMTMAWLVSAPFSVEYQQGGLTRSIQYNTTSAAGLMDAIFSKYHRKWKSLKEASLNGYTTMNTDDVTYHENTFDNSSHTAASSKTGNKTDTATVSTTQRDERNDCANSHDYTYGFNVTGDASSPGLHKDRNTNSLHTLTDSTGQNTNRATGENSEQTNDTSSDTLSRESTKTDVGRRGRSAASLLGEDVDLWNRINLYTTIVEDVARELTTRIY